MQTCPYYLNRSTHPNLSRFGRLLHGLTGFSPSCFGKVVGPSGVLLPGRIFVSKREQSGTPSVLENGFGPRSSDQEKKYDLLPELPKRANSPVKTQGNSGTRDPGSVVCPAVSL